MAYVRQPLLLRLFCIVKLWVPWFSVPRCLGSYFHRGGQHSQSWLPHTPRSSVFPTIHFSWDSYEHALLLTAQPAPSLRQA